MPYKLVQEQHDYTDLAAGFVLHSRPGHPAFPVRLTSEIFQRCRAYRVDRNRPPPYTVYDPCCGSAYLLTTLALLHGTEVQRMIGSDIDQDALAVAKRNVALLTLPGLEQRMQHLADLAAQFGKASHAAALASATRLHTRLTITRQTHELTSKLGQVNALSAPEIEQYLRGEAIDIIMTDIPYGQQTAWEETVLLGDDNPVWQFLESLRHSIMPGTILALTSNKQPKVGHDAYQRIGQLQIGKRRTLFYALKP